jgi:hypothetical protein
MENCKHNWIFQETYKNHKISFHQNYTVNFKRVDRYYCSNCCEIKEIEKQESVSLPFGGVNRIMDFAPVWY